MSQSGFVKARCLTCTVRGLNGEHKEIAKTLRGRDVHLVVAPEAFCCFHGVKRLMLNNVGLNEHLGRQFRDARRIGSDVDSESAKRHGGVPSALSWPAVASNMAQWCPSARPRRGRVWSTCGCVWTPAIADETINPDAVLVRTLKPKPVGTVAAMTAIAIDCPRDVLKRPEMGCGFSGSVIAEEPSTNVDIEVLARGRADPLLIRVFSTRWESVLGAICDESDGASP